MIDSADEDGRISSYGRQHEFDGWDWWSRKYVVLGMQYFMEICTDEVLNKRITESMKNQLDYISSKIGNEEGKRLDIKIDYFSPNFYAYIDVSFLFVLLIFIFH